MYVYLFDLHYVNGPFAKCKYHIISGHVHKLYSCFTNYPTHHPCRLHIAHHSQNLDLAMENDQVCIDVAMLHPSLTAYLCIRAFLLTSTSPASVRLPVCFEPDTVLEH